mgnify:CR=1 FL=1
MIIGRAPHLHRPVMHDKDIGLHEQLGAARDELVGEHLDEAERLAFGINLAEDKKRRPIARELIRTIEFTPELREEAARGTEGLWGPQVEEVYTELEREVETGGDEDDMPAHP